MPPDETPAEVQDTTPQAQATVTVTATEQTEQKTFSADYVKSLRSEAAEARVQLRDTQKALEAMQKSQADSAELKTQLDALQKNLAEQTAAAEKAQKEATLTRLAAQAGITDPDILAVLSSSQIDLTDEAKALGVLGKFAAAGGVAKAKPGAVGNTGLTEEELRDRYWGSGNKSTIFGD